MSELTQNQKLHNLSFADLCAMRDGLITWKLRFSDRPKESVGRMDSAIDIVSREINTRIEDIFQGIDLIPDNYSYMKNDNPELAEVLKSGR